MTRRALYQPVIVRFPGSAVLRAELLDFSQATTERYEMLEQDEQYDPPALQKALTRCRRFVTKDKELVFLRRPASEHVEWWDIRSCFWRPVSQWAAHGPPGCI